jgi:hypothetical protein
MIENKIFYFNESTNSYLTYCGVVEIEIRKSINGYGYFVWVLFKNPKDIVSLTLFKHLTQKYFKSISNAKSEIENYLIACGNKVNNNLIVFA